MAEFTSCLKAETEAHPDREYYIDGDLFAVVWIPKETRTVWSVSVWTGKTWTRYKTDDPEALRSDVAFYRSEGMPYAVASHKVSA